MGLGAMPTLDSKSYTMAIRRWLLAAGCAAASPTRRAHLPTVLALALIAVAASAVTRPAAHGLAVDVLHPIEALPPHVAGLFRSAAGFEALADGGYLVFDRGGHAVYRVDADRTVATEVVRIGQHEGHVIQPVAFDVAPDGSFAVADAPFGRERVQLFASTGARLTGFTLPGHVEPRVQFAGVVLNGVGSLQYDGNAIYVSQPESGALITEYSLFGHPQRLIGTL